MLHRERVELAIARKTPDRAPKGEIMIDPDFLEVFKPGFKDEYAATVELLDLFDLDIYCKDLLRPAPKQVGVGPNGLPLMEDCWGIRFEYSQDGLLYEDFVVNEPKKADVFQFPCVSIYDASNLTYFKKNTDRFIGGIVGGPFDNLIPIAGFDNVMFWSVESDESMKALNTLAWKAARFNVDLAVLCKEAGADFILIADDMAYNSGTFLDPITLRKLFFEPFKWLVSEIHSRTSLPVFLHCDGDINSILDDLVWIGLDGLQALQPSAGMDIRQIKNKYGKNLCLWGNIDLNYLLPFGPAEKITAHVKELAKDLTPGGGWILSTCNTLSRAVPFEHAKAMYDALNL